MLPTQDARNYCAPWGPTNSPMVVTDLAQYRREIEGLATHQQLAHCLARLSEASKEVQRERAQTAQAVNAYRQLESKVRDIEQELSHRTQRLEDMTDCLKNSNTSLGKAQSHIHEQWTTVDKVTALLHSQVVDGEAIDVPTIVREKELLGFEVTELKQSLNEKQMQLDSLNQELDKVKVDSKIISSTSEYKVQELTAELRTLQERLKGLVDADEQWTSLIAEKDLEIGQLRHQLARWAQQPVMGPVPQRRHAGRNGR